MATHFSFSMRQGLGTLALAALVFLGVGCGGAASGDSLQIDAVEPAAVSARGGQAILVSGRGFRPGVVLSIGTVDATVLEVTDTALLAETPLLIAGTYDLTVENTGGRSAKLTAGLTVQPLELAFREAAAHYLPEVGDIHITSAAAADVDGNGTIDVVLGVSGGPSLLLVNRGAGDFVLAERPENGPGPALPAWDHDTRQVILTDLDGDGHPDLYLCNASGEPDRVLRNDGRGRFTAAPDALPPRVGSCLLAAAGDLDGDGRPDLALMEGRPPVDDVEELRIYRNASSPGALRFTLADELLEPGEVDGSPYGDTYASDPSYTVSFTYTSGTTAEGLGAGRLDYDFAGVDGYVFYTIPVPGLRHIPHGLRMQVHGDGSGHLLRLRVYDGGNERFREEIGPVDWVGWQTVEAEGIPEWTSFSGDANGVFDAPPRLVGLELVRVEGSPEAGALRVDTVELWSEEHGVFLVEDFERYASPFQWPDRFSSLTLADLDGDGLDDLVLTASESATDAFLRILRSAPTAAGDSALRLGLELLSQESIAAPRVPVAFAAHLDLESDGDLDLFLVTDDQDRALVNDGDIFLFDDTETLLPVDRVKGRHAQVADLDLDGRADLVIANDGAANRLYLNSPSGRLRDETPALGLGMTSSVLVLVFDATGNGISDVLVVNREAPRLQLFVSSEKGGS